MEKHYPFHKSSTVFFALLQFYLGAKSEDDDGYCLGTFALDHVSNIQSCQPSFFPPCSVLSSLPLLLLLYSFIFHSQRRGVPCYHDRRYMRRAKQSISHLYILFFKSLGTYFCKETKKQPFKQTNKCKRCKLGLMLLSVHVFYNKGVYFILLYRQDRVLYWKIHRA